MTVNITCDESIAYDVLYRYIDDRKRIKIFNTLGSLEITKRMACLAFWVRKLKPLHYEGKSDPDIENYLNEYFGLLIALISCEVELPYPIKINQQLFADMLHQFRYKSVSPHSLNIILKAIVTECRAKEYSV